MIKLSALYRSLSHVISGLSKSVTRNVLLQEINLIFTVGTIIFCSLGPPNSEVCFSATLSASGFSCEGFTNDDFSLIRYYLYYFNQH